MLLGIDTGGTFTDFVLLDQQRIVIHKVLSTPQHPEQAILQGINELGLEQAIKQGQVQLIHGSTVATNAALENKGSTTLYVTNHGLKDVLSLGRQTRPKLYDLSPKPISPPIDEPWCLEVGGRLDAKGNEISALTDEDLSNLRNKIQQLKPQAVAINLLFSFLDPSNEQRLEQAIPDGIFVSRSSYVLPEYKEYERGIATWLNARLGPVVSRYLERLRHQTLPAPLSVMQSSGGTINADSAANRAVNLLLSGPAGGLAAALHIGKLTGCKHLLTLDMGGTSTDVALLKNRISLTNEGRIGPYPIAVPMVDMHTIGAGGGSIAFLDAGGILQVGPESAGADPGPACYGRGGRKATVTDANVVLGRLQADAFLGGKMTLNTDAAHQAIAPIAKALKLSVEEAAQGILAIANEHMVAALRVISIQRGFDPSEFTLCSFGGAGGLHICAIADAIGTHSAMVPCYGGVFSALGMLAAPKQRQLSQALPGLITEISEQTFTTSFQTLKDQGQEQLQEEGFIADEVHYELSIDLRYQGQSYALNIPWVSCEQAMVDFHVNHEQRYGHRLELPIETVNVRVAASAQQQALSLPRAEVIAPRHSSASLYGVGVTKVIPREMILIGDTLSGPLLITETIATTWIEPGWAATKDQWGNLLLSREKPPKKI